MGLARATGGRPWLYAGRPVLVLGGRIVAAAWGTQYAIRLPPGVEAPHLPRTTTWAGGRVTDITEVLGAEWRFGRWDASEPDWLAAFAVQ